MANLTRDDILKLAKLARISITDDEATAFSVEIQEILKYVEMLDAVDTTGLSPTSQVTGLTDVTRADEVHDYGYTVSKLIATVPNDNVEIGQIKVKRMIG